MTYPNTENENDVQGQEFEQGNEPDTQTSGTDDSSSQQDNSNSLYAEYLERFPSSLHPLATEVFKEWDGNVTKRIQSVHSEYEPYKPVFEAYEPDAIQQAVALAEAMERDPVAFYEAMANAYGLGQQDTQQQGQEFANQQGPAVDLDADDPYAVRLQQHEQLLETMGRALLSERQEREQAIIQQQEAEAYESMMSELQEKYGEFDVNYVNTLLANGADPDAAVQYWQQQVETFAQQRLAPNQTAPVVMGAGGGTPSVQRDVENLSSQETRRLVEDMLRQAAESGR